MRHFLTLFKNQSGVEFYDEYHYNTCYEASKLAKHLAFMTNLELIEIVEV